MAQILKSNFARLSSGIIITFLTTLFAFSAKTFAAGVYLTGDLDLTNADDTKAVVLIKATTPSELKYLTGTFTALSSNLTLSSLTPNVGMASTAVSQNLSNGRFTFNSPDAPLLLNTNDIVWKATFDISNDADAGSYSLQICPETATFAPDTIQDYECTTIQYMVLASFQSIYYPEDEIEKNLDDDPFINPLSADNVAGDITYSSTDESVATVDPDTGEVTIVGVGETEIIATAAAHGRFYETTARYTLTVSEPTTTPTPDPEPEETTTPESTTTDEDTIAIPDTGRSTSENNATNVASIIGIVSVVVVTIAIIEKRVTKKKVNFDKK